jgi:hypothetical protein
MRVIRIGPLTPRTAAAAGTATPTAVVRAACWGYDTERESACPVRAGAWRSRSGKDRTRGLLLAACPRRRRGGRAPPPPSDPGHSFLGCAASHSGVTASRWGSGCGSPRCRTGWPSTGWIATARGSRRGPRGEKQQPALRRTAGPRSRSLPSAFLANGNKEQPRRRFLPLPGSVTPPAGSPSAGRPIIPVPPPIAFARSAPVPPARPRPRPPSRRAATLGAYRHSSRGDADHCSIPGTPPCCRDRAPEPRHR